jgi:hypothetical protein
VAVVAEVAQVDFQADNRRQEVHKLDLGKLDKAAKTNQEMVAEVAEVVATAATAALSTQVTWVPMLGILATATTPIPVGAHLGAALPDRLV